MNWFGESWGAPVCEETEHVETPVGERCMYAEADRRCSGTIRPYDRGFVLPALTGERDRILTFLAVHRGCFLRAILGERWIVEREL